MCIYSSLFVYDILNIPQTRPYMCNMEAENETLVHQFCVCDDVAMLPLAGQSEV